jgi:PAS domain S-box-containing protein
VIAPHDGSAAEPAEDLEPRLERLRVLAVVLPLSYVAAIVAFLAINPLPSWASALVALGVSAPLVIAFTALVFNVVRTTRAELVQRERRIQGLVESAPDGIISVDETGTIVLVNQQAERMFGYTRDELVGGTVELLVPVELRAAHVRHRQAYQQAPRLRPMGAGMELAGRRKDGTTVPVEISLSPIRQDGTLLVTAVVRDISARRALEEERERLLAET